MRAWEVQVPKPAEQHPLVLVDRSVPQPGPGEVLLKVLACGVCHTDLHVAEGDLAPHRQPVVPGHEIVAEVVERGPGVTHLRPGNKVGVTWLAYSCGECEFCRSGRENLCPKARFTGYDVDGGYADYTVARADYVAPLPGGFDPLEVAPLLCAGVIGYRSLRLANVQPGHRLGLVGFGASAHLAIQVARYWGSEVYAFTRSDAHRQLALQMGAAWAGGLEDEAPQQCDSMVLFAPSGSLVTQSLRHLQKGGTLAINAVHLGDIPPIPYEFIFGERSLRTVSHVTRRDATEFLALAMKIHLKTKVEVFPFVEANEALVAVKEARVNGAAVLAFG
ncbi:MAG: zinc-dependent alcohol dehydrogenase family protein [Mycobacterium leprae]